MTKNLTKMASLLNQIRNKNATADSISSFFNGTKETDRAGILTFKIQHPEHHTTSILCAVFASDNQEVIQETLKHLPEADFKEALSANIEGAYAPLDYLRWSKQQHILSWLFENCTPKKRNILVKLLPPVVEKMKNGTVKEASQATLDKESSGFLSNVGEFIFESCSFIYSVINPLSPYSTLMIGASVAVIGGASIFIYKRMHPSHALDGGLGGHAVREGGTGLSMFSDLSSQPSTPSTPTTPPPSPPPSPSASFQSSSTAAATTLAVLAASTSSSSSSASSPSSSSLSVSSSFVSSTSSSSSPASSSAVHIATYVLSIPSLNLLATTAILTVADLVASGTGSPSVSAAHNYKEVIIAIYNAVIQIGDIAIAVNTVNYAADSVTDDSVTYDDSVAYDATVAMNAITAAHATATAAINIITAVAQGEEAAVVANAVVDVATAAEAAFNAAGAVYDIAAIPVTHNVGNIADLIAAAADNTFNVANIADLIAAAADNTFNVANIAFDAVNIAHTDYNDDTAYSNTVATAIKAARSALRNAIAHEDAYRTAVADKAAFDTYDDSQQEEDDSQQEEDDSQQEEDDSQQEEDDSQQEEDDSQQEEDDSQQEEEGTNDNTANADAVTLMPPAMPMLFSLLAATSSTDYYMDTIVAIYDAAVQVGDSVYYAAINAVYIIFDAAFLLDVAHAHTATNIITTAYSDAHDAATVAINAVTVAYTAAAAAINVIAAVAQGEEATVVANAVVDVATAAEAAYNAASKVFDVATTIARDDTAVFIAAVADKIAYLVSVASDAINIANTAAYKVAAPTIAAAIVDVNSAKNEVYAHADAYYIDTFDKASEAAEADVTAAYNAGQEDGESTATDQLASAGSSSSSSSASSPGSSSLSVSPSADHTDQLTVAGALPDGYSDSHTPQ